MKNFVGIQFKEPKVVEVYLKLCIKQSCFKKINVVFTINFYTSLNTINLVFFFLELYKFTYNYQMFLHLQNIIFFLNLWNTYVFFLNTIFPLCLLPYKHLLHITISCCIQVTSYASHIFHFEYDKLF